MKIDVPAAPAAPARRSRIPNTTTQIFIGLLLGILIGYVWPSSDVNGVHVVGLGESIKPLADTFLRMIKMIIAPLLFATLVVGIAGTGDLKAMGRIGLKAIIYFEVATTIALFLGLAIVNIFQPGVGVQAPVLGTESLKGIPSIQTHTGWDMLVSLFPTSVIDAMARGDILQVVVFSIFFGIGLAAVGERGRPLLDVLESTAQVMFKFTGYVMLFAPVGVMAAIARPSARWASASSSRSANWSCCCTGGLILFALVVVGGVSVMMPEFRSSPSCARSASRSSSRSRRPPARPPSRGRSKSWSASASPNTSSALCCRRATASTSTARRCICRSPACSSRRLRRRYDVRPAD